MTAIIVMIVMITWESTFCLADREGDSGGRTRPYPDNVALVSY